MQYKYILFFLFFFFSLGTNAQADLTDASIYNELIRLNYNDKLLPEDFEKLIECIKKYDIPLSRISNIRFDNSIRPIKYFITQSYRTYVKDISNPTSYCNGYYLIRTWDTPLHDFLFGVNSDMSKLQSFHIYYKDRKFINGGFKQGVPESKWEYEIFIGKNEIAKEENYKQGLLDGNYTITTQSNDTLYHTQFIEGTGYYKDFYPDGKLQMEGALKSGQADGRWILYVYKDSICSEVVIVNYNMGKQLTRESFIAEDKTKPKVVESFYQQKKVYPIY